MKAAALVLAGCGAAPAPVIANAPVAPHVETVGLPSCTGTCGTDDTTIGTPITSCGHTFALHRKGELCAIQIDSATFVEPLVACRAANLMADYHDRAQLVSAQCTPDHGYDLVLRTDHEIRISCDDHATCRRPALALTTGDPQAEFLRSVVAAIDKHDWKRLLQYASASHRHEQLVVMKQDEPTYLAELIGVHYADNSIAPDQVELSDLDRIEHVALLETWQSENPPFVIVYGLAQLRDGRQLRIELELKKTPAGYELTGAVG
ncbi:MAG: hypothetical protein QM831_40530 [Kofleriaceae bacterium]